MENLNQVDYWVIGVYFSILVGLGLYLKKRASASLESYFLGNRQMPWWALGVSGMASFLDIAGTMMVVSFLYMIGPRGLFIAFRGGAVLVLVVFLLWTGKWHRRSGCMTGAEWMVFRFGDGPGGQAARVASAVAEVVFTIGMLTYMAKGVGLFLAMFLPFSPFICSLILIGVATAYTMVSGFYGVVFTDMFQVAIILIAVISISLMAFVQVADAGPENLAGLAEEVTGSDQWTSSVPHHRIHMPKGYEKYEYLTLFAFFYLLRNIFAGMARGDDPKYFGARNDRECGLLTFLWTWLMMVRWPMMIGFAVLGLFLVRQQFPDLKAVPEAADLIKQHCSPQTEEIEEADWGDVLAGIMHSPQRQPEELIAGLRELLGDDWPNRLHLVGYRGTVNPERILPAVILYRIPKGLRGMLLIALIAASMSTFDSTANRGAGYFTNDLYHRYLRPRAGNRELIYASWAFVFTCALLGLLMGNFVRNINDIWDWIIMGLGGGMLVPLFLRFYWWRFNGAGFAIGMMVGLCGSILQRFFLPDMNPIRQFLIMLDIGLLGAILGTCLTRPTNRNTLEHFYRTTRPFGFWRPLRNTLSPDVRARATREHRNDLLAAPFTLGWQVTLFLLPMQLIIHAWGAFCVTLTVFLCCLAGMYVFWYRNLPPVENET